MDVLYSTLSLPVVFVVQMLKRLSYPLSWMETLAGEKEEEKPTHPHSADAHHSSVFSKVFSR